MAKIIGDILTNIPWQEPNDDSVIWRYKNNPIINRKPIKNVSRIFNSAIIKYNDKFVGIFRGDTTTTIPTLFYGESKDGINFEFDELPIEFYNEDGTIHNIEYAYDPRIVKIDDEFIIQWCDGFNGQPTIGLAKTKDFKRYTFIGRPFLPFNRNGVLFPRKINGEYVMLSRPSDNGHTQFGDIYLSRSKDLIYWGKHELVMKPTWQWWQSTKIGTGPIPIETDEGWVLLYHGVTKTCNGLCYSIGGALLDIDNPSKVLYRTGSYILTPEEDYEIVGFVTNVIFPVATLSDAKTGRIAIYYGAADTYVGLAFSEINRLIEFIKRN